MPSSARQVTGGGLLDLGKKYENLCHWIGSRVSSQTIRLGFPLFLDLRLKTVGDTGQCRNLWCFFVRSLFWSAYLFHLLFRSQSYTITRSFLFFG